MELLVVVGIIALLAVAAIPAMNEMVMAGRLASGGRLLIDEITFARQTALSRNLPVELRLYQMPAHNRQDGGPTTWRGFQVFEITSSGEKAIGNPKYLTAPVIMLANDDKSPLLNQTLETPKADLGNISKANVRYAVLRFSPSGMANVTNANNFVTLVQENKSDLSNGVNFVTVQVNPITGAARSYRP